MKNMITSHLLELKSITTAMVLQGRITEEEQIDFLDKAGLTKLSDKFWIDEAGAKYSS